jgi:hypothetical protein
LPVWNPRFTRFVKPDINHAGGHLLVGFARDLTGDYRWRRDGEHIGAKWTHFETGKKSFQPRSSFPANVKAVAARKKTAYRVRLGRFRGLDEREG